MSIGTVDASSARITRILQCIVCASTEVFICQRKDLKQYAKVVHEVETAIYDGRWVVLTDFIIICCYGYIAKKPRKGCL
jgi:hypothetical protein